MSRREVNKLRGVRRGYRHHLKKKWNSKTHKRNPWKGIISSVSTERALGEREHVVMHERCWVRRFRWRYSGWRHFKKSVVLISQMRHLGLREVEGCVSITPRKWRSQDSNTNLCDDKFLRCLLTTEDWESSWPQWVLVGDRLWAGWGRVGLDVVTTVSWRPWTD